MNVSRLSESICTLCVIKVSISFNLFRLMITESLQRVVDYSTTRNRVWCTRLNSDPIYCCSLSDQKSEPFEVHPCPNHH